MEVDLDVDFEFAAAHRLPRHDGPCARTHGHNYALRVGLRGAPDPRSGMLLDFEEIRRIVSENVLSVLDHHPLNDLLENPTAENIAKWCWEKLDGKLPGLREIRLWETPACSVTYRGR